MNGVFTQSDEERILPKLKDYLQSPFFLAKGIAKVHNSESVIPRDAATDTGCAQCGILGRSNLFFSMEANARTGVKPPGARRSMKRYRPLQLQGISTFFLVTSIMIGASHVAAQVIIDYPRDRATVVIKVTEVLGEIGVPDSGPSVQVHGDGYVLVHYPRYMKRAGDYHMQLSGPAMDDLMRSLGEKKVLEFDVNANRQSKRAADVALGSGSQSQGFAVLDASTTVIEVRVDRYRPAGGSAQEVLNVAKKIAWYGLKSDAKRYPNIEPIQNLAAVQAQLLALMHHPDLQKLP